MTFGAWLTLGAELLLIGACLGAGARIGSMLYRVVRLRIRIWKIQQEINALSAIKFGPPAMVSEHEHRQQLDAIVRGRR